MEQYRRDGKITGETKWSGTFISVGWELNQESLTLETGESMTVDLINFVAHVGESYRFWADGIAHVLELSESDEADMAVQIIQQRIQARIDRGENLDVAALTGRMLSSSGSGHVAICILASIVMLLFAVIGFYFYVTEPEKGGLESTVIAALAAVGLFALGRIKRPRLDVFETELQHHSFFGKQTNLKYEDIEGLSCGITRVVYESGKEKRVHTKIAIDGPEGTVRYSDSGGGAKELESLKESISDGLIRRFWTALQRGQSIPFGAKTSLTPAGLEQPDGSIISYENISEVRTLLGEGKIQLFLKDERKPALKITSKEKNFYPCVELLSLLADPSITYKQFCGPTITAVGPREETPPPTNAAGTADLPDTQAVSDSSFPGIKVAEKKRRDPVRISSGIQVLESRAVTAVWLLRITMLVMAVQIYIYKCLYENRRQPELFDMLQIAAVVFWVLLIVTGIFYLRWKYQASANLHTACERRLKYSPRACCGYYFFPLLNFFYPMQAMLEIQSRSKADVGYMVYIWWTLMMLSTFIERALLFGPGGDVLIGGDWIILIGITVARGVGGLFLIKIIKAVTEKQRRYRHAIEDIAT